MTYGDLTAVDGRPGVVVAFCSVCGVAMSLRERLAAYRSDGEFVCGALFGLPSQWSQEATKQRFLEQRCRARAMAGGKVSFCVRCGTPMNGGSRCEKCSPRHCPPGNQVVVWNGNYGEASNLQEQIIRQSEDAGTLGGFLP